MRGPLSTRLQWRSAVACPRRYEPSLEPVHADEISEPAPQAVGDTILGDPVTARAVRHRDLDEPGAAELTQRRQEAVDADERRQADKRLATVGLERAADVGDRIAEHESPR